MSHYVDLPNINAADHTDIINKEVVLNMTEYGYEARIQFRLLPYMLQDVFTAVSELEFQGERFLGLVNDTGLPAVAPAKWFNVLDV